MAQQTIRSGVRHWPYVMAGVVIGVALMIAWPVAIFVLAVGLIVGGIVAYRQSREPAERALAAGAIAGGVVIILMMVLAGLMLFTMTSGGTVSGSASDPVPVTEPAP